MSLIFAFLFLSVSVFAHEGKFHLLQKNWHGREVHVYLPVGYENATSKYPVLFMHDGQNVFDPNRAFMGQTWKAEKSLNQLIADKKIVPIVVVAIDNKPSRLFDYTHDQDFGVNGGGGADGYLDQIENDLIPLVESLVKVRTDSQSRGILGSSLGGLVSLYGGISRNTFQRVGALSPSLWWNNKSIFSLLNRGNSFPEFLYIDSGTSGGEKAQDVRDFVRDLNNRGIKSNVKMIIEENAQHREEAWARRFPLALQHLFPR